MRLEIIRSKLWGEVEAEPPHRRRRGCWDPLWGGSKLSLYEGQKEGQRSSWAENKRIKSKIRVQGKARVREYRIL